MKTDLSTTPADANFAQIYNNLDSISHISAFIHSWELFAFTYERL